MRLLVVVTVLILVVLAAVIYCALTINPPEDL